MATLNITVTISADASAESLADLIEDARHKLRGSLASVNTLPKLIEALSANSTWGGWTIVR